MAAPFRIGELARRSGRSEHTIRWYEDQGLLPNVGRDRAGRRVYEEGHVEHLVFLEWLRRTGMTVREMQQFTTLGLQGWRTLDERRARLQSHRHRVEQEIEALRDALLLIDAKLAWYDRWAAQKKKPPSPQMLPEAKSVGRKPAPRRTRKRERGEKTASRPA